ncbi:uncharacterized protein YlxW (UPF0749 family) [Desulfohalotomaculum tongense]|uniref:DUF881 domain-containing protein n=1 Tax=Desulforadius tongensis TaxID=1216062 RepID=UPI001956B792|nr:DUF881 domain-containing protein [Desulforadius tongensis]MBM7855218.1 uncharacterized protein YlxW (UPF0749 family) [Desulforadius tongensis]
MKIKGYHWAIGLVAVLLGIMLAVQFQMNSSLQKNLSSERTEKLTQQIEQKKMALEKLQARVEEMRQKLDEATARPELGRLKVQLDKVGIMAGTVPVVGPGIEVTLNDSNVALQPGQNPNLYVLHDEDVLKVLNELKAAGAEALAINDQRLIATSEIRCIGPTILTNGNKRLAAPFVITAIGNPDTLYNALFMKGGVAEQLKDWGIQVSASKMNEVIISAYSGAISYEYGNGGDKA